MYVFDSTGSVNNAVRGDSRVETLFPTADASVAFTPSQGVIGAYYSLSNSTSYISGGQLFLRKFTAPVSGTVNSISIVPAASASGANFKPAIYADNTGSPGTLLSSGSQVTGATASTTLTMPLTTPQSLTAGTSYWLGYVTDTALTMQRHDNSSFATNAGYTASITYYERAAFDGTEHEFRPIQPSGLGQRHRHEHAIIRKLTKCRLVAI